MAKIKFFISDFKQLIREPIMIVLFLAPILIAIVVRIMYIFLIPFIQTLLSIQISLYDPYILSVTLLFSPMMLGVVMGFMMLDDKDAKIIELMSITPLGRSGYIINRLSFILIPTVVYTIINYLIINIYILDVFKLIYISIISSLLAITVGLIFASLASDKIKGLTYAKGLNLLVIFAFGDLFKEHWMRLLSSIFPTYWISKMIIGQYEAKIYVISLIISIFWLFVFIKIYMINLRNNSY